MTASFPMAVSGCLRRPSSPRWLPTRGQHSEKEQDTQPVATLKLLTTLRNSDVEPTAALLNPVDYKLIRTLSDTSPYLSGPPITVDSDGTEQLSSVPLIVTPSVPDDTALVADMRYRSGSRSGARRCF